MAEPENFEEDLFADLYTEDDAPAKQEPAPAVKVETVPSTEAKSEMKEEQYEQHGAGDEQMYGGEADMDDEIDFNLGNGNGHGYDDTPVSHHEAHGPGIKEDG